MATLTPRFGDRLGRFASRRLDVGAALDRAHEGRRPLLRHPVRTAAWLVVLGVFITLVAPEILGLTRQWSEVEGLGLAALAGAALLQLGALGCLALMHHALLPGAGWRTLVTSQLAGHGLARVTPGGSAAGSVLQHGMLVRAGSPRAHATAALTTGMRLGFAAATILPVIAVLAAVGGGLAPGGVLSTAGIGLVAFGGLAIGGWTVLRPNDRRAAQAFVAVVGRTACDFASLLIILAAIDAHPRPALILLAFCAGQLLAQVPVTPGGMGFVETGMTLVLSLAGVTAGPAALATFTYRLLTYWLVVPAGLAAYLVERWAVRRAPGPTGPGFAGSAAPDGQVQNFGA